MPNPEQCVAHYLETAYDVRLPGGRRATLRIGKPIPESVRSWGEQDWPLFFVSACNPFSQKLTTLENRSRTRALMKQLERSRRRHLVGIGHVAVPRWRESSFLVAGLSIEAADRLAMAFGQNAILITEETACPRLRVYRNDWRARIAADADIMWTKA